MQSCFYLLTVAIHHDMGGFCYSRVHQSLSKSIDNHLWLIVKLHNPIWMIQRQFQGLESIDHGIDQSQLTEAPAHQLASTPTRQHTHSPTHQLSNYQITNTNLPITNSPIRRHTTHQHTTHRGRASLPLFSATLPSSPCCERLWRKSNDITQYG